MLITGVAPCGFDIDNDSVHAAIATKDQTRQTRLADAAIGVSETTSGFVCPYVCPRSSRNSITRAIHNKRRQPVIVLADRKRQCQRVGTAVAGTRFDGVDCDAPAEETQLVFKMK